MAADFFSFRQPVVLLEIERVLDKKHERFFKKFQGEIRQGLSSWRNSVLTGLDSRIDWGEWLLWERNLPIVDVGGAQAYEIARADLHDIKIRKRFIHEPQIYEGLSNDPHFLKLVKIAVQNQGVATTVPLICISDSLSHVLRESSYCCIRVLDSDLLSDRVKSLRVELKKVLGETLKAKYSGKTDEEEGVWILQLAEEEGML